LEKQNSKIKNPHGKNRYSVNFFITAVLLTTALIWVQYWDYKSDSKRAVEYAQISMRESASFTFKVLYKLVKEAEEGGQILEKYFKSIKTEKGFALRMVHSEAVNVGFKRDKRQQPKWEEEKKSLNDGKIREWKTDNFLYLAMPLKANEHCRKCHYLPPEMIQKIPIGYPVGLVEFKLSLDSIKNHQAELMKHTATTIGLMLVALFVFGFIAFSHGKSIEESEKKFRYAGERFEDVALTSGEWIWEMDNKGYWIYSSSAVESVLGYRPDEVIGVSFLDFIVEEEREKFKTMMISLFRNENSFTNVENRKIRKDGKVIIAETSGTPFFDSHGDLLGYRGITRDITQAKKAEQVLRESEQKIRAIIDSITSFVYMKDLEGRYLLVNDSFLKRTGKPIDEIIGKSHFELFPKDSADIMNTADKKVIKDRLPYEYEEFVEHDGLMRAFLSIKVPLLAGSDGEPYGLVGITTDITDRKKAEIDLLEAKEKAVKATLLKDKFISLVSHDLKSPLATMLGFLRLIRSEQVEPVKEGSRLILDSAINSGEHMVHLIEDLLHLGRIKTGDIILKSEFTDAYIIGVKAMANLGFIAETKGIKLINDIPPKSRIYCDPALLHEVIQNFVTNAIKFSIKGGKVRLYMKEGTSSISVSDMGVGVREKQMEDIFSYETKTTTVGTSGERGTGLGLPLAHEIIEAHGGKITVESSVGEGSTFSACLPEVKPNILIVDDDEITRAYVRSILEPLDAEFIEADDGQEAWDIIKESPPTLVISDITMPKMDGFALLEAIRKNLDTADLPVILMTAHNEIEISEKAVELGASDFAMKPLKPEEIIPRIRRFIS